ncbi:uncharacterized protein LOC115349780 [Aquila chrysaetos chrysaetos]|uniref:uncharacterized protein LOC115349780 n=1 Tax=Aquila chrysaetos chrysaetos TaxID=223781 RepID=UPI001B7D36AE|nr:uncharacterized protein LOC115349780 [Aquila chrysaetos chrysaetos]
MRDAPPPARTRACRCRRRPSCQGWRSPPRRGKAAVLPQVPPLGSRPGRLLSARPPPPPVRVNGGEAAGADSGLGGQQKVGRNAGEEFSVMERDCKASKFCRKSQDEAASGLPVEDGRECISVMLCAA